MCASARAAAAAVDRDPPRMGLLAFILSAALLAGASVTVARRLGRDAAERFWVGVAAAQAQIGMASLLPSFVDALTPLGFLATQAGFCLIAWAALRRRPTGPTSRARRIRPTLDFAFSSPLAFCIAAAIALFVGSSAIEQFILPVWDFDDRMYHASRAAYWIQHRSLLAWPSHNDRQVAFPLAGELWFFWPLLMTRVEALARFAFWFAYPLTAIGVFLSLRGLELSKHVAAAGALVYCATPIVLYHTQTLHPDLWTGLYTLGAAYWAVRALRDARAFPLAMAGVFVALAVGTRAIALPLLVGVLVVPWLTGRTINAAARGTAGVVAGIVAGVLLGGSVMVFVQTALREGHPLGSAGMRKLHQPALSPRQVHTHAVRWVLTLADLPVVPGESLQQFVAGTKNRLAAALGAGEPLPLERPDEWPGPQAMAVPLLANGYSLAGWAWLPAMLVGWAMAVADLARTWPRPKLRDAALVAVLVAPAMLATVFAIRWMDGMTRFWVGPYVASLLVIVPLCAALAARRGWGRIVLVTLLAMMVIPALYDRLRTFHAAATRPLPAQYLQEPFAEPLRHIPDGSTILLVGHADARDWPLFRPERGLVNRVVSWGKQPFDPSVMRDTLGPGRPHVTHVLIEDDRSVNLYWDGRRSTVEMVQWLRAQPEWRDIPLPRSPGMRLFARRSG